MNKTMLVVALAVLVSSCREDKQPHPHLQYTGGAVQGHRQQYSYVQKCRRKSSIPAWNVRRSLAWQRAVQAAYDELQEEKLRDLIIRTEVNKMIMQEQARQMLLYRRR